VGDVDILHTPGRIGDFRGARVSGQRAAAELGWRPTTGFTDGVRRYLDWYVEPRREADLLPD
jgi:UDP-glucose 4-epimerase